MTRPTHDLRPGKESSIKAKPSKPNRESAFGIEPELLNEPDLSDPTIRRTLTPTALRGFFHVAGVWELNREQMCGLLGGISSSTLNAWRRNSDTRVLNQDTLTRIFLLIGIHKVLVTNFGSSACDQWITHSDHSVPFNGAAPVDHMIREGIPGMCRLRKMLDECVAGR